MPLDDFLLRNEQILATAKGVQETQLYATNLRVIKYQKGWFNERMESLYYSHINAASYNQQSYIWLVITGLVCIIVGAVISSISDSLYYSSYSILISMLSLGLILTGLTTISLGIIYGIFRKPTYYKISAVGLSNRERRKWRTSGADAEAKTFARFVQDQINTREMLVSPSSPLPPQPPNITKAEITQPSPEPVLTKEPFTVYCRYCRKENRKDSAFCMHCGQCIAD